MRLRFDGSLPILIVNHDLLETGILRCPVEMTDSRRNLHHIAGFYQNSYLAPFLINSHACYADDSHRPVGMPSAVAARFKRDHIGLGQFVNILRVNQIISMHRPHETIRNIRPQWEGQVLAAVSFASAEETAANTSSKAMSHFNISDTSIFLHFVFPQSRQKFHRLRIVVGEKETCSRVQRLDIPHILFVQCKA